MVVQGNLENLGKHLAAEDPLRRYVDRATQGAARGATLVQHLLAFARRQNLFPAQLDLAERMAEAVELLRGAVGHAIVLDWRPEPDLWPVETDATQLEMRYGAPSRAGCFRSEWLSLTVVV
jgi:signal transduction histidine kinase